jgi:sigma54-dependent transcription regulator
VTITKLSNKLEKEKVLSEEEIANLNEIQTRLLKEQKDKIDVIKAGVAARKELEKGVDKELEN